MRTHDILSCLGGLCLTTLAAVASPATVPRDVARSIASCWHAPHAGDEVTLRMSFRADGSVFGQPRITYIKAMGGAAAQAALEASIFEAVHACSPVRFDPSLGAAIAGRIFLIRFVAPGQGRQANRSIQLEAQNG